MSVQPDQDCEGPNNRHEPYAFARGFEDLEEGHLNHLVPSYFETLDGLITILREHGIVPVIQPVFHGYGWRGQRTLGNEADPNEYARYCRYLLARYGAEPAIWLVGADGDGLAPGIEAGGALLHREDAYAQPTGIQYSPFPDHGNKSHQDAEWLDFQWCQTGHDGNNNQTKLREMVANQPRKAVANGESTYERMHDVDRATGFWQADEALRNLMAGGTMGVVYGACGLWQWKLTADESWDDWTDTPSDWQESMEFDGSTYFGFAARALKGIDLGDVESLPEHFGGREGVARPGEVFVTYLPSGGEVSVTGMRPGLTARWFQVERGEFDATSISVESESRSFAAPSSAPWVLVIAP